MYRPLVIMPCLDMIAGRVVKGVRFVDIKDAGDPVECCRAYCAAGADELAMLDITATLESRSTLLDVTRRVAEAVTVPFTMGGGINSVSAAEAVLNAGANKFSTSSAAFRNPAMLREMVKEFGPKTVTVAIDVLQNPAMPSGYEVYIDGGNTATGRDAVEWAKRPDVDVVASGGAGTLEHFAEAAEAGANVLLAASVFHFHIIDIPELKKFLEGRGFVLQKSP